MAQMGTPPWYVLTGAPSSGKSTLIKELAGRGYTTVEEAARFVIEREVAAGKDFRELRARTSDFQHEVLRLKLEWEAAVSKEQTIFFDRGIPDSVAYYAFEGIAEDAELKKACARAHYRKVFVLDLISPENFTEDGARSETWEGAQQLDRLLEKAYRDLGFAVLRVPVLPVPERADFVLANL
jgi:predicted ATPase